MCSKIINRYMMGSSSLLVGSRQTFAFARDGAIPFSRYFYRINSYTKTPVNTVWLDASLALAIGLLSFASTQAINAVFTLAVTSSYVSYITPIVVRFAFQNDFKPGPFYLGKWVSPNRVMWSVRTLILSLQELPRGSDCCFMDGFHEHRFLLPRDPTDHCSGDELHGGCTRRFHVPRNFLVLLPCLRRSALVQWARIQSSASRQGERLRWVGVRGGRERGTRNISIVDV